MISLFKNFALLSVFTLILYGIGQGIDVLIPWTWLVTFFAIIRDVVMIFDFFWDTTTLFVIISISLLIEISFWTLKAFMAVIETAGFNKN